MSQCPCFASGNGVCAYLGAFCVVQHCFGVDHVVCVSCAHCVRHSLIGLVYFNGDSNLTCVSNRLLSTNQRQNWFLLLALLLMENSQINSGRIFFVLPLHEWLSNVTSDEIPFLDFLILFFSKLTFSLMKNWWLSGISILKGTSGFPSSSCFLTVKCLCFWQISSKKWMQMNDR